MYVQSGLYSLILICVILVLILSTWHKYLGTAIVHEYEAGLMFINGKLKKQLAAGRYHYNKKTSNLVVLDTRIQTIIVPGQEVLTKDNINIKMSLIVSWQLKDAQKAFLSSKDYLGDLYLNIQTSLRLASEKYELDELLINRSAIGEHVLTTLKENTEILGIEIHSVNMRDVMMPAALKRSYAGAIEAKKEALTRLETARGEQAVLRKLANVTKVIKDNPGILELRALQTISEAGNLTVVLGADGKIGTGSSL